MKNLSGLTICFLHIKSCANGPSDAGPYKENGNFLMRTSLWLSCFINSIILLFTQLREEGLESHSVASRGVEP